MAKIPTQWKTSSGLDNVTSGNTGFFLLLETGFKLLLETGSRLILENNVITPKEATSWAGVAKPTSSWAERSGSALVTVGLGSTRLTEQSDTRITEQGDTRITEVSTFTEKIPQVWAEI